MTTTDPTATPGASMGGRGTDPALTARIAAARDAEPLHWLERTVTETVPSPHCTAREAYDIRVRRLRDSRTPYAANPQDLTVTYTVETEAGHVTTTLRWLEERP